MTSTPRSGFLRIVTASVALPLLTWATSVAVISYHPSARGINLSQGASTFRDRCGACHFLESGISTHHGPNLNAIGATAATRKPGVSAARYLLESILEPDAFVAAQNRRGMPRNIAHDLTPENIRNLVAYLATRGGSPDYDEIRQLEIPDFSTRRDPRLVRRVDMELAERLLADKANCLQCHSRYRNAEYQVYAPSLFGMGLTDAKNIRDSITQPSLVVAPTYSSAAISLANGEVVTGRLISSNAQESVLLTRDMQGTWTIRRVPASEMDTDVETAAITKIPASPMPTGFDRMLNEHEMEAIVTLLRQLN